jgi:hypothetical protein
MHGVTPFPEAILAGFRKENLQCVCVRIAPLRTKQLALIIRLVCIPALSFLLHLLFDSLTVPFNWDQINPPSALSSRSGWIL